MSEPLRIDALVLYKARPARVTALGDKIDIEVQGGERMRVRPKDVTPLHPGPCCSFSELAPPSGELESAWELLAGSETTLPELAELVYGAWTPASAWAAWQLLQDDLHFHGPASRIAARTAEEVATLREARTAKAREQAAWEAAVARARAGRCVPEDEPFLREVEDVALERRKYARLLKEVGIEDDPVKAHAFLLRLRWWTPATNPHPLRLRLPSEPPTAGLAALADEPRRDLTHLAAFAIDDAGNQDPDDALSVEDGRIWVHVADVAALVPPGSPADVEARARGANLYLPEGIVPMLPPAVTHELGLGLREESPALSFGLDFGPDGELAGFEIVASRVRVTRLSYEEADARIGEAPFAMLDRAARAHAERRARNGAIRIEMPEVKIRARDGRAEITPLPPLASRALVREMMLAAGEAAARHAIANALPFPFNTQPPPDKLAQPEGLPAMYAARRAMRRGQIRSVPEPHAGVGLAAYSQVTSPLRRYLDLVAHQQLRALLRGEAPLDADALVERIGAADAASGPVRQAERFSNRHWTVVYLMQHRDWRGEGVLVNLRGRRGIVIIPELALETSVALQGEPAPGHRLPLVLTGTDLPQLEAYFRIAD